MKIKEGFVLREICGVKIIMGEGANVVDFGKLVSVNDTSAWIWEYCAGKEYFDEEMIVEAICREYDVEKDHAMKSVCDILSQWKDLDMIEYTISSDKT